jgi:hypothetical protein
MSFQNPGSPRFYVDILKYYKAIGVELEYFNRVWREGDEGRDTFEPVYAENGWGRNPYHSIPLPVGNDPLLSVEREVRFPFVQEEGLPPYFNTPFLPLENIHNYINYFGIFNWKPIDSALPNEEENPGQIPPVYDLKWSGSTHGEDFENFYKHNPDDVEGGKNFRTGLNTGIVNMNNDSQSQSTWLQAYSYGDVAFPYNGFSLTHFPEDNDYTDPTWYDFIGGKGSIHSLRWSSYLQNYETSSYGFEPHLFNRRQDNIGGISIGRYYDLKAPDMRLTFERSYERGLNRIKTRNGSTLTNIIQDGPPEWDGNPHWTLLDYDRSMAQRDNEDKMGSFDINNKNFQGSYYKKIQRSGRRKWSLNFSMMADDNMMSAFEKANNLPYGSETFDENEDWPIPEDNSLDITGYINPLLEDDSFYSQVIVKTLGGNLGFYFLPDSSNTAPDQFAYCKFRRGSFRYAARGSKIYDIRLVIEESW